MSELDECIAELQILYERVDGANNNEYISPVERDYVIRSNFGEMITTVLKSLYTIKDQLYALEEYACKHDWEQLWYDPNRQICNLCHHYRDTPL